ncbi:uncharacterized protein LAJ45_01466 [Morchella importuna]|uniref:uncharacterized protein n=1 Tax=Morchella importuna TaxID=1174673 RepID=UPI001E8EDDF6|nr:uncharacterized protein LAJ45_01466 [Morchella importuna]KAH8154934.1 hypothetical protein LAJ45_01466 [Morchella importuna]
MLWVAAQTCDAPFLAASPAARGRVCQKLLEICISLLRPLVHVNLTQPAPTDTTPLENLRTAPQVLALVDLEVHLAVAGKVERIQERITTMVALSMDTGEGIEAEPRTPRRKSGPGSVHSHHTVSNGRMSVSEEDKEERRRTWWLLYVRCENLYLPMDDIAWQNGDFYTHDPHNMYAQHPSSPSHSGLAHRRLGPSNFEVTGTGLFEFFLPLMTILGEIVDLHHARNRPKFGVRQAGAEGTGSFGGGYDELVQQITQQLDTYSRSLQEFESANSSAIKERTEGGISEEGPKRGE